MPEHRFLDLLRDDGADAPEIFADSVDLDDGAHEIFVVSVQVSGIAITAGGHLRKTTSDRMPNRHPVMLLAMAVDTAIALLHHVRIPWNLDVDEVIAVILEVDAF